MVCTSAHFDVLNFFSGRSRPHEHLRRIESFTLNHDGCNNSRRSTNLVLSAKRNDAREHAQNKLPLHSHNQHRVQRIVLGAHALFTHSQHNAIRRSSYCCKTLAAAATSSSSRPVSQNRPQAVSSRQRSQRRRRTRRAGTLLQTRSHSFTALSRQRSHCLCATLLQLPRALPLALNVSADSVCRTIALFTGFTPITVSATPFASRPF